MRQGTMSIRIVVLLRRLRASLMITDIRLRKSMRLILFFIKMIILNYRKILKIQAQQNTLKKTQNIPITTVLMMQLLITHLILIIHLRIKPSGRLRQIQMPIPSAIYTTIQKIVTAMCLVLLLSQLESIYGITTRIFRSF